MNKYSKLVYTGISAVIAVLVFVAAAFAWFTLSTNPEVTGLQVGMSTTRAILIREKTGDAWTEAIDMSQAFQNAVPLRPVSTADGIHWYLPSYKSDGTLENTSKFPLDDKLEHANIFVSENDTEAELIGKEEKGYYVYADFWLKTEEELCEVHLSVPAIDDAGELRAVDEAEKQRGIYGSYVLAGLVQDEEQQTVIDVNSRKAESAVRVGFLVEEERTQEAAAEEIETEEFNTEGAIFYIYEPNADMRSAGGKPTEYNYVAEYTFNQEEYTEQNYLITHPVVPGEDGRTGIVGTLDARRLLVQRAGSWKETDGVTAITAGDLQNKSFSRYVDMGRFVKSTEDLYGLTDPSLSADAKPIGSAEQGLSSDTVIVTLKKDVPRRIRMFIWIEGQDPDCWNDISAGSFMVNLEFGGTTKSASSAESSN